MSKPFFIPLPRDWSRWVKSALVQAVGLERLALLEVRAGFENSPDQRAALVAELDRSREEVAMLKEEIRIKDARMAVIPIRNQPHYPPPERLAIEMLRARAGWTAAETGRRFGTCASTITRWGKRLDEGGPDALVQTPVPVNRFDDVVTLCVQKAHAGAPGLGRRMFAEMLCRAGVKLAASTARRMVKRPPVKPTPDAPKAPSSDGKDSASGGDAGSTGSGPERRVTSRYAHHLWHMDLTRVASGGGWWVPWWPFALIARWALCWHIAVVQDHYSRAIVAFEIFKKEPTAAEVCSVLDAAVAKAGRAPRHIVTDRGCQFQGEYLGWCERHQAKPRFGALGAHGSIAVCERLIKSLKFEYLRKILIPLSLTRIREEVGRYVRWYNEVRPHTSLRGATPAERLSGKRAKVQRLEPRARYPLARGARRVRGKLELVVTHVDGRRELPVFELRDAA
jgi:transposase InsO family protein